MTEILNSIWTILTTENENLATLILLPLAFVEVFISMLLFLQILNIKTNRKQKIIYFLVISTWSIITSFLIPKHLALFINMIIYPISIFFIFKTTIIKSILCELIPIIIISIIESIIANFNYSIFNISYMQLRNIPLYRFYILITIYTIIFLFYFLSKKLKLNINIFDDYNTHTKQILISEFIFGIITIGLQYYLILFYIKNLPFMISIISLIILFLYFVFSIYTLTRINTLEVTKKSLEETQLYNKTLQILHDNVRAFRHDFSNIIAGIGGYVQTKDMEGLEKYYSQLLVDCQCTNNLTTLCPDLINNPAIYNVLANKYHKADGMGIKIELSIFYDFNKLNIKIYELTRILGILLDNAIEATQECDKKFINVIIRDEPKYNRQIILIENTYKNKNIDTDKIYEKGFSTKPGNTGLGLWQIRQILKKNNNLNLFTSKDDEYFRQSLEMYNK